MKKLVLSLAMLIAVSASFTSCNKDTPIVPPMFGYWQCVGIGGDAFGASVPTPISEDLLKFFSIGYLGVGTSGKFVRVGTDAGNLAGLLTEAGAGFDQNLWRNFLSGGDFNFTPETSTSGTITHTTTDGVVTQYRYELRNNGNELVLTEIVAAVGGSGAGSALDILNLIFGTNISNTVGIQYVYRKVNSFAEIFSKD